MKFTTTVAALLPSLAAAHYHFPQLIINDKVTGVYEYVREHDNGYMPSMNEVITTTNFRCNKGAEGHKSKPKAAKVTAGRDIIGFVTNVNSEIRHPGPLTVYLSKAPNGNVATYDGDGDWFKVWQLTGNTGFNGDDTTWLSWGKARFSFRLPAEIPAGQYLARIEHMAVHQPYKIKEWFFQCAHLDIASSYTGPAPGPLVKFPGAYSTSSPAINWDSWKKPKDPWPQHGPNMWPNNSIMNTNLWGQSTSTPPPPSSGPPPSNPPSSPPSSPPSPPPSSPPPSGCAAMYGQCGGSGYSGPKCCSSGSCKMSNEWYSQCL